MLPGGKAAVICNGCDQRCEAPAFARAGRAGGTHSRGAVAGRGHCAAGPPRLAGGRPPWPGSLLDPSYEPRGEPPRAGAEPGFTCARIPVRIPAGSGPAEAATPTVELPTIPAAPRAISLTFLVSQREGVVRRGRMPTDLGPVRSE